MVVVSFIAAVPIKDITETVQSTSLQLYLLYYSILLS